MDASQRAKISTVLQVVILLIGLVAVAVGYHALQTAKVNREEVNGHLAQLQQQLLDTRTKLEAIGTTRPSVSTLTNRVTVVRTEQGSTAPVFPSDDPAVFESLLSLEGAVSRLEEILDVSGVEDLATNLSVDPQALQELVGQYTERRNAELNREQARERFQVSMAQDVERYGEDIQTLFDQSRMRFGRRGNNNEDREAAYKELQEKYPDSYAAAAAVGENALGAAFRRDVAAVEGYYEQLKGSKYGANVTTEWGLEVTPAVEYYLANQYVRDGRYTDAQPLLESLEQNYSGSYVFNMNRRGRGGRGNPEDRFQPVGSAVSDLRNQMENPPDNR